MGSPQNHEEYNMDMQDGRELGLNVGKLTDMEVDSVDETPSGTFWDHWRSTVEDHVDSSDSEDEVDSEPSYPRLKDSDGEDLDDSFVDWSAIEAGSGLSA